MSILDAPSTSKDAWQFRVVDYGAKGDGTTDDTVAIRNAITAAVTYAATSGNNYVEVLFRPGTYFIGTAPSGGTSGLCNAQIPIDPVAEASQKVILVLRGTRDQSALYHWQQTTPQMAGVTLKTAYVGGLTPTANNEPSVIGGPTGTHGYTFTNTTGTPRFSNMHIVIDGIGISVPQQPQVAAFDLRSMAEATVISASVLARSTATGAPAIPDNTSGLWAWGLAMPDVNNNDICDIGHFSCEGMPIGMYLYEHVQASSVRLINCFDGIVFNSNSGFPHANNIQHASVEACFHAVAFAGTANKVGIELLDIEWGPDSGAIITDGGNIALGYIIIRSNGSGPALSGALASGATAVNGTRNVRIVNGDYPVGAVTAPTLPATTVALPNPFYRDAAVSIAGGTVTSITVDGQVLGVTSGTVFVPTGKSITVAYSSAPTWKWTLL